MPEPVVPLVVSDRDDLDALRPNAINHAVRKPVNQHSPAVSFINRPTEVWEPLQKLHRGRHRGKKPLVSADTLGLVRRGSLVQVFHCERMPIDRPHRRRARTRANTSSLSISSTSPESICRLRRSISAFHASLSGPGSNRLDRAASMISARASSGSARTAACTWSSCVTVSLLRSNRLRVSCYPRTSRSVTPSPGLWGRPSPACRGRGRWRPGHRG